MTDANTINLLLPEIVLVAAATIIFVAGAFFDARGGWRWIACCALALAGATLVWEAGVYPSLAPAPRAAASFGPITGDYFAYVTCWFALGLGLLLTSIFSGGRSGNPASQWPTAESIASLLLVVAGMMLTAQANDLVLLFLALELISIPTYVLLVQSRTDMAGREATLKYFFLSVVSSGLLLYGFSFVYGATGSMGLAALGAASGNAVSLIHLGLLLALASLGLKIALAPFHFYAADVYQGTSPSAAALLATAPKVAGIVVLLRLGAAARLDLVELGWQTLMALAVLTMTVGNVMALWQQNVRRLLAYSSVAHAGYLMIGLCVWAAVRMRDGVSNPGGQPTELAVGAVSATLFYLAGYAAATIGAFAAVSYLGQGRPIDRMSDLHGAARRCPGGAAALSLFMLSLTGLPPLVGFWGKLMLIVRALAVEGGSPGMEHLRPWFLALAIITVLNAAISAGYYFRIVAAMYFRPAVQQQEGLPAGGAALAMGLSALIVIALGLYPAPLIHYSDAAAKSAVTPISATSSVEQPKPNAVGWRQER